MDIATAITNLTTVIEGALDIVTGNVVLTTIFVSGLMATGFKLIKKAKNAVK